jgi:tetratricopeptide (TPR) repeat protein
MDVKRHLMKTAVTAIITGTILLAAFGCSSDSDKIPITTSSKEARDYYLMGRNLLEMIRTQEAQLYFEKALKADSNFAMAYLQLAYTQPTTQPYFDYIDKAVALKDSVSEGERLFILATQAGMEGELSQRQKYLEDIIKLYPNDERAYMYLGNFYFGLQDWDKAIEVYNKAVAVNEDYSPVYNQLGYAYRYLGDYDSAEKAFRKYVKLNPEDPNPYDSYAELLLKMGKFGASIDSYEEALKQDPHFIPSYLGIATNWNLKGRHDRARKELQRLLEIATTDFERRNAYYGMAVSFADEGRYEDALKMMEKELEVSTGAGDNVSMAADNIGIGGILYEMGRYDEAMERFLRAHAIIQKAGVSATLMANADKTLQYQRARVALGKGDLATARAEADDYMKEAIADDNPFRKWAAHELLGRIALQEEDYDRAIEEFQQTGVDNPYNLYRRALAYEGAGNIEKAKEFLVQTIEYRMPNSMAWAFCRTKAKEKLDSLTAT